MIDPYYPRLLKARLEEALEDTPVVLIHGPRQCGKTTLAQIIGEQRGYTYFSFDDANLLAAAKADPVGFVDRLADKVILDEVQHVPELFISIKRSVDKDRKPGRFILTGSANVLLLPKLADSLAGRMEIMSLRPLARCEIESSGEGLLAQMLRNNLDFNNSGKLGEALAAYVVVGGFPEPLQRKTQQRKQQWFHHYVDTLIQKDIQDLARINRMDTIPKILQLAAGQSAQLLNMSVIAAPFQISRQTISSYFSLLRNIFLVDVLPAWHTNRGKRLIKTPKVHITDTGLAATLLGLTAAQLDTDRAMLGHLLESFVYNELVRQASWAECDLKFYHFRDKDQYEVDIVIEQGGSIIAVEVKASATIRERDFAGLKRLQTLSGKAWKLGIVFYDGELALPFGQNMFAVPISALWGNV
ncbi:MAG: ATP-binding protein [Gammaproteobacteria bacterium]|nr:MAG: ATP-binding protein [Gammaproteobacteria bacterium]